MLITVDGPPGTGTTSVAQALSTLLDCPAISIGNLYRAFALAAIEARAIHRLTDGWMVAEKDCAKLARSVDITTDGKTGCSINGVDVTDQLQGRDATSAVAYVSAIPSVRQWNKALIRGEAIRYGNVVIEGRGGGNEFPEACKFELWARPEVRMERQVKSRGIEVANLNQKRHEMDTQRALDPVGPIAGATIIDTSDRTVDQVIGIILESIGSPAI